MTKQKYSTVMISDIHVGKPNAQTEKLLQFLKNTDIETLIINGDLIDFRQLSFLGKWTDKETIVMNYIVERVNRGMKLIYIKGNHDAFIRKLHHMHFNNVSIVNDHMHTTENQKRYYICHGDRFDFINYRMRRLGKLLNLLYTTVYLIERSLRRKERKEGHVYYEDKLKLFFKNIFYPPKAIERKALRLAKKKNCDGVILGHYHRPDHIKKDGKEYINTGDRVTSCTAVVENEKGNLELIHHK